MNLLLLLAGGVLGALSRYHAVTLIQSRLRRPFPLGTVVVNLSGCLILGTLAGLVVKHPAWPGAELSLFAGTGFCGAYTTFSSYCFETIQLWRAGQRGAALVNALGQPLLGLLAAWAGLALGAVLL